MNRSASLLASKRRPTALLALLATLGFFLPSSTSFAAPKPRIAIIYDIGGRGDGSINDAAAVGIDKAKAKFHLSSLDVRELVTEGTMEDRQNRLEFLAKAGYQLIICVGPAFAPALQIVDEEYPKTQFAIIGDQSVAMVNVSSIVFDNDQVAYLSGAVAAATTASGKIGLIEDPADPRKSAVADAFTLGAKLVKRGVRVIIRAPILSPTPDVRVLSGQGVDVIFSMWSYTNDAVTTIAQLNARKLRLRLIGISPDQYFLSNTEAKRALIATVNKRIDLAIISLISATMIGSTVSDVLDAKIGVFGHRFSVADGGVELIALDQSPGLRQALNQAQTALKSGKVKFLP